MMLTKQQQLIVKTVFEMLGNSVSVTGYSVAQRLEIHVSTVYAQIKKIKKMEVA